MRSDGSIVANVSSSLNGHRYIHSFALSFFVFLGVVHRVIVVVVVVVVVFSVSAVTLESIRSSDVRGYILNVSSATFGIFGARHWISVILDEQGHWWMLNSDDKKGPQLIKDVSLNWLGFISFHFFPHVLLIRCCSVVLLV